MATQQRLAAAIGALVVIYIAPLAWLAKHPGLLIFASIVYTVLLIVLLSKARNESVNEVPPATEPPKTRRVR